MADIKPDTILNTDRLLFKTEFRAIWLVAIVGLSLSFAALWLIREQLDAHKLLDFEWVAHNRIRAINHGVESSLLAVTNIRDLYAASNDVEPAEFEAFAESQLERYKGIALLMWITGTDNPETNTPSKADIGVLERKHPWRFVIHSDVSQDEPYYVGQFATEDKANFESDLSGHLVQLLEQIKASGAMEASAPIELSIPGNSGEFGFLAGLPVYPRKSEHGGRGSRNSQPAGFVVGLFRMNELVNSAIALLEPRGVEILLLDSFIPSDRKFLHFYSSRLAQRP